MIRKIIRIDQNKCNGCGLCAKACHEGAIEMIDGKAKLTRENFCDGFGDCLPECPMNAISFEEREAPAYDEAAVKKAKGACPGMMNMFFKRAEEISDSESELQTQEITSQLRQWPVQLKLLPVQADFYNGADILIAADCTAYAYGNFHDEFIRGRIVIIACPKLDMIDYSEKLAEIIKNNNIKSLTLVRMEVPCCGGLQRMLEKAVLISGKNLKIHTIIITRDGNKIEA